MNFRGSNLISKAFLFYYRRIGDHPAKLRIINALHRAFKDQIKVKGFNDTVLTLIPGDYISGKIIADGAYEPVSLNLALEILKGSNGSFIDVGANIGLYTTIISKTFPGRKIIAIEPEHNNYAMLNKNIALNRSDGGNICTLNIAVGPAPALIRLERPLDNNCGTFRVVVDGSGTGDTNKYYPMLDLDTVFKSLDIVRISLLKIDVEGFEMDVFKGINWDEKYKPENIIMEFSDYVSRTGTTTDDVMRFLTAKGYKPYTVDKKPYSMNSELPEGNLLFRLAS